MRTLVPDAGAAQGCKATVRLGPGLSVLVTCQGQPEPMVTGHGVGGRCSQPVFLRALMFLTNKLLCIDLLWGPMRKTLTPRKMRFAKGRLRTLHLQDPGYLLQGLSRQPLTRPRKHWGPDRVVMGVEGPALCSPQLPSRLLPPGAFHNLKRVVTHREHCMGRSRHRHS